MEQGGLMIYSPPYGERLSELPQLAPFIKELHDAAMKLPIGLGAFAIIWI